MNSLRQLSCWQSVDVLVANLDDGKRVIEGELVITGEVLDPEPVEAEGLAEEVTAPSALDVSSLEIDCALESLGTGDDPEATE